jgi:hypothetical protein
MVTVPYFCPDTPALTENPVFLYSSDRFQKPYPFRADIAVALDEVFNQKLDAIHELESQVYDGGAGGSQPFAGGVPPASQPELRKTWLREVWEERQGREANQYRDALNKRYGPERGQSIKFAEAFEICEYGRQPSEAEIRKLFPFFESTQSPGGEAK